MTSLKSVATPCIDDHQLSQEDFTTKGELAPIAARVVLTALYVARLNRHDLLWAVNTLARQVTKWNQGCDKRLHRLISYMYHTQDYVTTSHVGDPPDKCVLALFVDASFAGDLQDSKSTTGGYMVLLGPNTYAPITWLCKKQGAVSHSSSEAEIIALDATVRMEGIPAMELWDLVIDVLCDPDPKASKKTIQRPLRSRDDPFGVDYVTPNYKGGSGRAKLHILEDNEAVIQMVIKCRAPNMRHCGRTHRVDLDWLIERIKEDTSMFIRYVNTKQQLADILTKGSFTQAAWEILCRMAQLAPSRTITSRTLQQQQHKQQPKQKQKQKQPKQQQQQKQQQQPDQQQQQQKQQQQPSSSSSSSSSQPQQQQQQQKRKQKQLKQNKQFTGSTQPPEFVEKELPKPGVSVPIIPFMYGKIGTLNSMRILLFLL